ncbi:phosphoribosylanthranilate isomerase [Plastorhodobacter daqingensis]|uniref:N-(5'-phosphoribosyl)anthranilate isomerase n=1 Tax=Plastorhodobacter daqingensis TaxID=1387281 RepID=A0ABW2UEX9_9RHOB
MAQDIRVKICGLTRPDHIEAAARAGAAYLGLVFFERSPRNVSPAEARDLCLAAPPGLVKVALTVDADDAALDAILAQAPIDMLQLHGHEAPERVAAVRRRYGLPVMKAVGIADAGDLGQLDAYMAVADQVLIDAKPPRHSELPGGNGLTFDWRLLTGRRWPRPWMLAGGLTAANVAEAVRLTGAGQVDVSSGVERAPGKKDEQMIARFISAAQGE